MKVIQITPEDRISLRDVSETEINSDLQNIVGGYYRIADAPGLAYPYVMLVDEDGCFKNLGKNRVATALRFGLTITGNVVIAKMKKFDFAPFEEQELQELYQSLREMDLHEDC